MSADDWVKCPFCKKEENEVEDKYGKIPMDEWLELREKTSEETQEECPSVRVDYEHFIDEDNNLRVIVRFSCRECEALWEIDTIVEPKRGEEK